ncbi:RHO4 protein [Glugoides intestinalis]
MSSSEKMMQELEVPPSNEPIQVIKQLTLIGRGECGKTSILYRFLRNEFKENINATLIENEDLEFTMGKKNFKLKMWDTSGQDEFSRFRALTLPMSDYVAICYSIIDPVSFYEVEDTLIPMIRQKAREDVKIVLIATKVDMRTDDYISTEEGIMLAKKIGAIDFFECSSLSGLGIKEIFRWLQIDMFKTFSPKNYGSFQRVFCC